MESGGDWVQPHGRSQWMTATTARRRPTLLYAGRQAERVAPLAKTTVGPDYTAFIFPDSVDSMPEQFIHRIK